jgi:glycosyltransferase involved in cell wall biosynthesis
MQLTIVGDGTAFPVYSGDLQRSAVHPGIRFVGRLERSDVWSVLANADALIVPSLYYETASLVVQEAHAIGIPVIAANHGALAERVTHEIDGLLVPPGNIESLRDAILRLAYEPDLLARLREGIRPVTSMEVHQEAIESLYTRVLEGSESHGAA